MKLSSVFLTTAVVLSFTAHAENPYGCDVAYSASSNAAAKTVVVCANHQQVIFAYGTTKGAKPETLLVAPKAAVTLKQETTAKHAMTETKTTALYIPVSGVNSEESYVIRSTTYMVNVMKVRTPANRFANIDAIPPGDILENVIFDKDSERADWGRLSGVAVITSE